MRQYNHTRYCMQELANAVSLPGDVIELGVAEGATTFELAKIVKRFNHTTGKRKAVFACDTFTGLPHGEKYLKKGQRFGKDDDIKSFTQNIVDQGFEDVIVPVPGIFDITLDTETMQTRRFCFAWVDADLEASTRTAIDYLKHRMCMGGIIGFHDYGHPQCPGVKPAVDELIDQGEFRCMRHDGVSVFLRRVK